MLQRGETEKEKAAAMVRKYLGAILFMAMVFPIKPKVRGK